MPLHLCLQVAEPLCSSGYDSRALSPGTTEPRAPQLLVHLTLIRGLQVSNVTTSRAPQDLLSYLACCWQALGWSLLKTKWTRVAGHDGRHPRCCWLWLCARAYRAHTTTACFALQQPDLLQQLLG